MTIARARSAVSSTAGDRVPSGASISMRSQRCTGAMLSAVGLADPDAELLGRAQRAAAGLAVHGERGREARPAFGTAGADLAAALRALARKLWLPLLEVALCEPAGEAERDPVAQRPAPFLPQPVRGPPHRERL